MNGPISNASDLKLYQHAGDVPDMSDAITNYFQPMIFTQLVKQVVNFQNVEVPTNTPFMGVIQPFTVQQLKMKDIGQRAWSWFTVHSSPALILAPDEVIQYQGVQYRVMEKLDYKLYGYLEYHIILDYSGAGPNT